MYIIIDANDPNDLQVIRDEAGCTLTFDTYRSAKRYVKENDALGFFTIYRKEEEI